MSTGQMHEPFTPEPVTSPRPTSREAARRTTAARPAAEGTHGRRRTLPAVAGSQAQLGVTDVLEVPFAHKRLVIGLVIAAIAVAWGLILCLPRSYESEAKLMVRAGYESVSLDPTATTSQTLLMEKTHEEHVNSALDVLGSRFMAEKVVDALGEDAILSGALPRSEDGGDGVNRPAPGPNVVMRIVDSMKDVVSEVLLVTGIRDALSSRETAIREVMSCVTVSAPKQSTVLSIHATAPSPELARAIAATFADQFKAQHLEASRTEGSLSFFEDQVATTEKQLQDLLDRRTKFKQENGIVSVDANLGILTEQLRTLESQALEAQSQLDQAVAEMEDLKQKLGEAEDEVVAEREQVFDETWSGMRQTVYDLELQEQRLSARYSNDYAPLLQVREQLTGARKILEKMKSERVNESTILNPAKLKLTADLQALQTKVVGLRALLKQKTSHEKVVSDQVNELHQQGQQLSVLDRDISLLETNHLMLREKLQEASIIDQLQSQQISSVNVVQPATFVERAVSPNKKLLAFSLCVLGLMGGIGLAFVRELNSETMRTETQVESNLQFPVIASTAYQSRLARRHDIDLQHLGLVRERCRDILAQAIACRSDGQRTNGLSLGVMSLHDGGGASTLASALAMESIDQCRLRTILVDADARKRTVTKAFGLENSPGFSELAAGEASQVECIQHSPQQAALDLVAPLMPGAGRSASDGGNERAAIERFQEGYELVVVDLPSADRADSAHSLLQHVDILILVVESEQTLRNQAARLSRQLQEGSTQVLGVVLNKRRSYVPRMLKRILSSQSRRA